jgi:hypothetical protein
MQLNFGGRRLEIRQARYDLPCTDVDLYSVNQIRRDSKKHVGELISDAEQQQFDAALYSYTVQEVLNPSSSGASM